uniref:M-1 n=1 Tax=Triticum monococcum subsp. aegilopoides TaxID=52163 RepID=R4ZB75_TRIMO|nr:M-1 [Triticum monococcum subsp. aegilopoides]
MGVKCGVVVWCLLLAGLLLLAVASAAERDTEKEKEEEIRLCKKVCDCKAGEDTGKARECKEQCERRRHGHELLQEDGDSFDSCVSQCRGHGGWWGKERWDRCRRICRQSQEGEGGDDDFDEGHNADDDFDEGHNADDRCERMCQRYHDRREKKQCMKGCRYGESGLLVFDDGHEHGDRCQTQCKRFRPGSYDRQQCIEKCQCQQKEEEEVMNHHGGGGHGHGDRCQTQCKRFPRGSYDRWQCTERCQSHQQDDEELMNHHGGHESSSCEQKCQQRHRHEYDRQQCVRDCKSGGGGGAGGRGREGDERQHDRGMVVEAILEEV